MNTRLLVITGPTASGKSSLALQEARRLNGEIISVDSMQLYRGIEIGTAQPTVLERQQVPHHLVGIYDFSVRAEVFTFCELAEKAINDIQSRGKLPILAGGTGFYLKALLGGLDDLPADPSLRHQLDQLYDSDEGEKALHERMAELDPLAFERWKSCRRRLIRALEVRLISGKSIIELQSGKPLTCRFSGVQSIFIMPESSALKERISLRCDQMFEDGWIDEARQAFDNGLLSSPTAYQALGYSLISEHLAGKMDFETLKERVKTATWQFARRQRTFLRHQLDFLPQIHPQASGEVS